MRGNMEYKSSLHPIIEAVHHRDQGTYSLHGWELSIAYSIEEGLCIETAVFQGEHFIPLSVRAAVHSRPSTIHPSLQVVLRIDEEESRVILHYTGNRADVTTSGFNAVLEEFTWLAEQWWQHLDERSRGDLLYVHVRP